MTNILNLLSELNLQEKEVFVKILGLKDNNDDEIALKISKLLLPAKGLFQEGMTYKQFIKSIAKNNNEIIDFSQGMVIAERKLYVQLFQNEFEKLSDEEKLKVTLTLEKAGLNKSQISSLSGITALGAAQLSGFGIYVLASSTVGAITSLLGITLPFALYTGMSSVISFVIGPVGFLVMGVMLYRSFKNVKSWNEAQEILNATWKELGTLLRGDYSRATQIFKYIAASRILLEENCKAEIDQNKKRSAELTNYISDLKTQVQNIESEISLYEDEHQNSEKEMADLEKEIVQLENKMREIVTEKRLVKAQDYIKKMRINSSIVKKKKLEKEIIDGSNNIKNFKAKTVTNEEKIKKVTQ